MKIRKCLKVTIGAGVCLGFYSLACSAQEVSVYDTKGSSTEMLSAEQLSKKDGWSAVDEGKKTAVTGCAVLVNPKMAVVLRPKSNGPDIYAVGPDGAKLRAHLVPLGDAEGLTLTAVTAASAGDSASLDAVYKSAKGTEVKVSYSLGPVNAILKTQPGAGALGQCMEAPSRLGVLPDFFADDMVLDARTIPVEKTEIPGENFFMNMLDNGNSIVTAVWDKSKRDVELRLKGEGDARMIAGVNVYYGDAGSIWISTIEEKGIWGTAEISAANVKTVIPLDWKSPWKAKWRGDFVRVDHTVDSWGFAAGPDVRHGWSGVVGKYDNPCWFDAKDKSKAFIQPPTAFPNGNFAGPFVVYPIERTSDTPLDRVTITDVMRNSLGLGPCEYIMDVASQGSKNKGIYTCSVEHSVPPVFAFGQQKEERVWIDMMCREVQVFVKAIQDRINSFVSFRTDTLKYLAEQKTAHPDQVEFIAKLEEQVKRIQATPVNNLEPVSKLVARLQAAVVADTPKDSADKLCEGIAGVGLGGDNMVARCRQTVKVLRQMATIEMAINPKSADVAKEMRKRTQQILRGALGHEMI